ncbi:MAG: SDR family NAD(P)-dependent oxidoreductase [Rhodospirillales bacterium]|nr:SDR family NAD(P)-dependent oxidoreductase [Rhodospirillales bacterium]
MDVGGSNVLVTGADGFIGSHLVERLVAAGARVTALSLYNAFDSCGWLDSLAGDVRAAVRIARGDVRDPQCMDDVMAGQEIVFHLAALIGIPYSYAAARSYVDVNVTGTLNVLEAARRHGVGRVVHTSTSEVYGTALRTPIDETHPLQGQSPYAASKIGADAMVEAYARSHALQAVTLRPFNTFGPRQSERAVIPTVIRQALDPRCAAIRIGDATPRRDFSYVADTVEAFLAVATSDRIHPGSVYNSGAGVAASVADVVDLVRRITGTDKPLETQEARFRPADSEVRLLLADAERLSTATGWRPRRSLESGLETTVAWWRERIAQGALRPDSGYVT